MLANDGIPTMGDLLAVTPPPDRLNQGPVAVIECFQEIPCNPCADACPRGAITMPDSISKRPLFDAEKCNGCGICVTRCPGLAIFILDFSYSETEALLKIPYEFSPLPTEGENVDALNRAGKAIGIARVRRVQLNSNKTILLWLAVSKEIALDVRNIRRNREASA
ncbi:MAG: 4Fe-4S dicluster domain-containing protein [Negativicutes bacterium]